MDKSYYCSCGRKPKFIRLDNEKLVFWCEECKKEFAIPDEDFGYLPMRVARLQQLYP